MKKVIILIILPFLFIGCANNKNMVDPNYAQAVNAYNQSALAKAQMVDSLVQGCKESGEDSAWCINSVTMQFGLSGNLNGQNNVPQYTPRPTKGDIILSKGLDIIGKALPIYGNLLISKDNNDTNARIAESNNNMMSDIITSGYNNMSAIGSQETMSVGGNYIVGDGNGDGDRYGDGNLLGDNNTVGDGNVRGNDNIMAGEGSIFGDGNTQGDGNLFSDGIDNIIGDANRDINGNDNLLNNTIGDDLLSGPNGQSDIDNSSPQPNEPEPVVDPLTPVCNGIGPVDPACDD